MGAGPAPQAGRMTPAADRYVAAQLVLAGMIFAVAWTAPEGVGAVIARRSFGALAFVSLYACLIATPWAGLHPGTRRARLLRWREPIGLGAAVHTAGHALAMIALRPVYMTDWRNGEDWPGMLSSSVIAVLAATSLRPVRSRLAPRTWKRIHRFIHVAFALICPVVLTARLWTAIPALLAIAYLVVQRRRWAARLPAPTGWDRVAPRVMAAVVVAVLVGGGPWWSDEDLSTSIKVLGPP